MGKVKLGENTWLVALDSRKRMTVPGASLDNPHYFVEVEPNGRITLTPVDLPRMGNPEDYSEAEDLP